jgi:nicotinate-nucleotide adenylyltransferase
LGTDALSSIDTWRDSEQLAGLAKFIVVTRPGFAAELPNWPKGSVKVLEIDALNLSSTEIRQKIEAGHNANDLVPKAVAGYISSNGLYLGNHD